MTQCSLACKCASCKLMYSFILAMGSLSLLPVPVFTVEFNDLYVGICKLANPLLFTLIQMTVGILFVIGLHQCKVRYVTPYVCMHLSLNAIFLPYNLPYFYYAFQRNTINYLGIISHALYYLIIIVSCIVLVVYYRRMIVASHQQPSYTIYNIPKGVIRSGKLHEIPSGHPSE